VLLYILTGLNQATNTTQPMVPELSENQFKEEYWTEPRLEMKAWFQRNAPPLGDLYEGALRMIDEEGFPGQVRLVAHAVREIRNRLPDAISGEKRSSRLEYRERLDKITTVWGKAGFSLDGTLPTDIAAVDNSPNSYVRVPVPLFQGLSSLVKDHTETSEKRVEAAFRLFEAIAPENERLRETMRPVVRNWVDITEWFVKKAHATNKPVTDSEKDELQRRFRAFEDALGALVRGFFNTSEGLDEIIQEANS